MGGVEALLNAYDPRSGRRAKWIRFAAFGVGHVQNDLCAAIWFTYFLIFYQQVLSKLAVILIVNGVSCRPMQIVKNAAVFAIAQVFGRVHATL